MKKKGIVAIFPAGSEIGLEINRAIKYSTFFEVIGFSSIKDHTEYVYKKSVTDLPFFYTENFIDILNDKILKYNVDYIYPANDDVQLFLTENKARIKAKIITSDLDTVKICRSKNETYTYLGKENFIPKIYQRNSEDIEFPVFIKPDIGQGSKGAKLIKNRIELENELNSSEYKNVICEYLSGEEYTIDCFTDLAGKIRSIKKRNRKRIRLGISVNSEILELDDEITEIANKLNNYFNFNGAWFFQVKRDNKGKYKLLEVSPRISGTMGVSRNTGTNFPLLTLFQNEGKKIEIIENNYKIEVDRAFINRYKLDYDYENIYVDFDDTLVIENNVNTILIAFLYQKINTKKIILITKHRKNIYESLEKYKIASSIFSEIICLEENDEKSKYIINNKSIFIDDSFSERKKVSEKLKIPVFDVSEVESLLEWK